MFDHHAKIRLKRPNPRSLIGHAIPSQNFTVSPRPRFFVDTIAGAYAVGMSENSGNAPSESDEDSRESNIPADAFSLVVDPAQVPDDAPADKSEHQER